MDNSIAILNDVLDEIELLVDHVHGLAALCEATGADAQRGDATALTAEERGQALLSLCNILHGLADKLGSIYDDARDRKEAVTAAE